jgi:hypothetical protein
VGIPATGSRFDELVSVLGIEDQVSFIVPDGPAAAVKYKASDGGWRSMAAPLVQSGSEEELAALRATYGADDAALEAFGTMYLTALGTADAALEALDEIGMAEWMAPFGLTPALRPGVRR